MASTQTLTQSSLTSIGNLIKLLPTGTVFLFQYLNPLLTNNGRCDRPVNKYTSGVLIAACSFSCCFASFTDSYIDSDGVTRYGIATRVGLWPDSSSRDLSSYRLRVGDFVHAFCALVVFGVVVLLDPNCVRCYYPLFESTQKVLLMVLPPVVGAVTGAIFVFFPNKRHGIGYPHDPAPSRSSTSAYGHCTDRQNHDDHIQLDK